MELHHSTENNDDKPYLQHVCPSCSYVYDESKGFKKRHPPGKATLHELFMLQIMEYIYVTIDVIVHNGESSTSVT